MAASLATQEKVSVAHNESHLQTEGPPPISECVHEPRSKEQPRDCCVCDTGLGRSVETAVCDPGLGRSVETVVEDNSNNRSVRSLRDTG